MYRIAIVDDNETWCFVLALRLQQLGYSVSTFTNAQAFLDASAQFDLVLVDFSMPSPPYQQGMDGPELIGQVKCQFDNPPLLVLISSFFTDDLLSSAFEICPDADAIIGKQTEPTEIFSLIRQLLKNQNSAQQKQHYHCINQRADADFSRQS